MKLIVYKFWIIYGGECNVMWLMIKEIIYGLIENNLSFFDRIWKYLLILVLDFLDNLEIWYICLVV